MPEPGAARIGLVPIADLGEHAWWEWDDFPEVRGDLRVCTSDALYDLRLELPDGDPSAMRDNAIAIAELVIG